MNIIESIRLAFTSIKTNKLRSVLTMLGIIIGISSVITITTIGNSIQKTISSTLSSFGNVNTINASVSAIYPSDEADWANWEYPEMDEKDALTYEELSKFKDKHQEQVDSILVTKNVGSGILNGKKYTSNINVMASSPGYFDSMKIDIIQGRDITDKDNEKGKATAVVSDLFVKYACGNKNPLGNKVEISMQDGSVVEVYVVGIYKYDKQKFGAMDGKIAEKDIETMMIVPLSYGTELMESSSEGVSGIDRFEVITKEGVDPTVFKQEIIDYFNATKYGEKGVWEITCFDMASELDTINKVLTVITIAIAIIAAISLIVGGVGVMNIMLVSVIERTREIGIRKALGAKNRHIHMQFLTESIVICFVGGMIGIALGVLNGFILAKIAGVFMSQYASGLGGMLQVSVHPSMMAILVSVIFSMLIGIVFGSYPAKRAAKMSPIDALRYE